MDAPNSHPLIGAAAVTLDAAWHIVIHAESGAILLDGPPGVGKTDVCDRIAARLCDSPLGIERINGQSLGIEVVRSWRERGCYGNLFSRKSVKRIDELDHAGPSAMAEMLTLLDYLPAGLFILATTNDYARLRSLSQGRLESRFVRFSVTAPTVQQTARLLMRRHKLPLEVATAIATGAVPEGCLATEGCNVRAALKDALGYMAAAQVVTGKRRSAS